MEHYDAKDSGCHIFMGGQSYTELFSAIQTWFDSLPYQTKAIETIVFEEDGETNIDAYVYFCYLSKEADGELTDLVTNESKDLGFHPIIHTN